MWLSVAGERKLTIRLREGSDGYHLARYPHSGLEHANDCRFYAAAPQRSGLQGYAVDVVAKADDGGMKVRLYMGVWQQAPGEVAVDVSGKVFAHQAEGKRLDHGNDNQIAHGGY